MEVSQLMNENSISSMVFGDIPLEPYAGDAGDSLQSFGDASTTLNLNSLHGPPSPIKFTESNDGNSRFGMSGSFSMFSSRDQYPVEGETPDDDLTMMDQHDPVASSVPSNSNSSLKTSSDGTTSTTRTTSTTSTTRRKIGVPWTTEEEAIFYKALRKNGVNQTRDVKLASATTKLPNRSIEQVQSYYYRILIKINNILEIKKHKVNLQQEDEAISALLCYNNTLTKPEYQALDLTKKPYMV